MSLRQGLDIAVIGGGLAGLAAAWHLGARHRVTLYERHASPGFTAHAVSVPHGGQDWRIDVPLRVFYPGYYPSLLALYNELGVQTEPVNYATTFTDADGRPYFRYRNWRWGDRSFGYVLPQDLASPQARQVLAGALRFRVEAARALRAGELQGQTLADHVLAARYPAAFVDGLLLPMVSTICTCPDAAALRFPAELVVDYLLRGVTRQAVRRARLGADDATRRLLGRVAVLRCGADVRAVRTTASGVELQHGDAAPTRHDHVVIAAPAQHARALLAAHRPEDAAVLAAVQHHRVEVVVHRDAALMPAARAHWSPVNATRVPGHPQAMATIWINAVQPGLRDAEPVFQTVAPARAPRADRVLSVAHFDRPVVEPGSLDVPARLADLHAQPGRRVWFCGSYAQTGIPLLEAAVGSAARAAQMLQASIETVHVADVSPN